MILNPDALAQDVMILKRQYYYRDLRMDFWHNMWLLRDINQYYKNRGFRRYITNFPAAVVDKSTSVLARHNWRFWINMVDLPGELDNPEQRSLISDIERSYLGLFSYIDRELISQGYSKASRVAAWYALVRGWICSYTMLNTASSPIDHKFLDPRDVYPRWAGKRLSKVYHCPLMSASQVKANWPDADIDLNYSTVSVPMYTVIEYLDEEDYGVAWAYGSNQYKASGWLQEPVKHGIVDQYGNPLVPAVVLPVNGSPSRRMPTNIREGNTGMTLTNNSRQIVTGKPWQTVDGWTAEMGRSIYASIEDAWPLFNEILALTLQIVSNEGLGTIFAQSRSGTWAPTIADFGRGAVVPGRLDDRLSRLSQQQAPVDSRWLLDQLMKENHWGTVSPIIFADTPFAGSGFLFGQMESTALNSLGAFRDGLEQWGRATAELIRDQFKSGKGKGMSPFASTIRNSRDKFISVAVKPSDLAKLPDYTVDVELKPGLPDDMLTRVNIARQLLDPRRPIASLRTVFDLVLGWDDPDGELDRIFEDMAMTDPIIVLERVAQALERHGLPEIAVEIRDKEFKQKFIQEAQFNMIQQQLGGAPPSAGASAPPPEVQPPEQVGQGREQQQATGGGT